MALLPEAAEEQAPSADRLPTLTEVVQLGAPEPLHAPLALALAPALLPAPDEAQVSTVAAEPAPLAAPHVDADALAAEVLSELAPRIDMLLQARLREALAPALARAADGLIRDARDGLATTLRELVDEAVVRALKRRSGR